MDPAPLSPLPGRQEFVAAAPPDPKPANAPQAAQQFEALLLAQMLRAAHDTDGTSDSEGGGEQDTMWAVAAEQFSQVIAQNGGLGLGRMITASLQSTSGNSSPAPKAPLPR